MTVKHTTTVPFADWGPTDRYWLDAFDPGSDLHRFLPVGPVDAIAFPEHRLEVWERQVERRTRLVEAFRESALPLSAPQKDSLKALADPRAMAVVTGQQPGALGGPLYTFAKILSAVIFAAKLSERWKLPVVPILWDGGDDHDLDEIAVSKWLGGPEGTPTKVFDLSAYAGRSAWQVPFTDRMLGESIEFVTAQHPPTEYREATIEFLKAVWVEGASWCDVFDRFWLKVFEDSPLLVVRPWEPAFRELAAQVLEREIENPRTYLEDLSQTSNALETAGYSPRIHKKEGACSFFFYREGKRCSVVTDKQGEAFALEAHSTVSKEDLLSSFEADPGLLSPNALLRPLVQDSILPVAATVLGPSEIAYHAQLGGMYERHEILRPWILPRLSLSSIGPNQRSRLDEMGLALPDLRRDANELAKSLVSSEDLDTSLSVLDDLIERTNAGRGKILAFATRGQSGGEQGIDSQFSKVEKTLRQIADLLRREELKRNTDLVARINGLQGFLLPEGDLQERTVGLVPFLCRFGFGWLKRIQEEAREWTGQEHAVFTP